MRILIVNDDSIHAPGLALLAEAAMELGEVWVVAPASQCSAMSHKLSIQGSLKAEKAAGFPVPVKEAWQIHGSPADCVKTALQYIMAEKPDYVFSGINDGCNAGFEIAYSGTLGAAFEAVMNGIPAMAFSNAYGAGLDTARQYLGTLIHQLLAAGQSPGEVWNINFPDRAPEQLKGILWNRSIAPTGMINTRYVGTPLPDGTVSLDIQVDLVSVHDQIPEGTDVSAVLNGYISIGKVRCPVL